MIRVAIALALGLVFLLTSSCKREENFPDLKDEVAGPIDVAVAPDGLHFYVLNSDFDRTYNAGSILVLDQDGNKVSTLSLPRLGRNLVVAGNRAIVTVDRDEVDSRASAFVLDLTDPANPTIAKEFELVCSPFNAVARDSYDHFAISCTSGTLYVGTFGANLADSTLKRTRRYAYSRRAMHIDPVRELLFMLPTDVAETSWSDDLATDVTSYDDNGNQITDEAGNPVANEIPDKREESRSARTNTGVREVYQYVVYDLLAEEAPSDCTVTADEDCVFPFRESDTDAVESELRWLYFSLLNFDGTPDPNSGFNDATTKYYRTNFWHAEPDPFDPDVFYVSHRGKPDDSPHANQIVKVKIVGDLRATDGEVPFTADVLEFERVYGFKGAESTEFHFPADFELTQVDGAPLLLINHFRSLEASRWKREEVRFSLAAKVLDQTGWTTELVESKPENGSYYQVALSSTGRGVTCSFFGNEVILIDARPGVDIAKLKRIE